MDRMDREAQLAQLSELLARAADARTMTTTPIWSETWTKLEQELLERLLECGPTDDEQRYRRQTAIEIVRQVRRIIETTAGSSAMLERELGLLDGRLMRPIA